MPVPIIQNAGRALDETSDAIDQGIHPSLLLSLSEMLIVTTHSQRLEGKVG